MKYIKGYKIFESVSELESIKDDVNDILLELMDDGFKFEIFIRFYDSIKFQKDQRFSGHVLVAMTDHSVELNYNFFETLERLNRFCQISGFELGIAEMYLPFEKCEDFILRMQGRNNIGHITIIVYNR
jgi:hypothetical protein